MIKKKQMIIQEIYLITNPIRFQRKRAVKFKILLFYLNFLDAYLVEWQNSDSSDATWEEKIFFEKDYPEIINKFKSQN